MAFNKAQQLEGIGDILQDLYAWIRTAEFKMEANGDIGRCVAADRRIKLDALFRALGIQSKVWRCIG